MFVASSHPRATQTVVLERAAKPVAALLRCCVAWAAFSAQPALVRAQQLLAASFQAPNNSNPEQLDPDADLSGILQIDVATGQAATFIPVGTAGMQEPTALAIGPLDGHVYVGTNASGRIYVFDGISGEAIDDPDRGIFAGRWLDLGDVGIASVLFDDAGVLHVAAAPAQNPFAGFVARLDTASGVRLTDALSSIEYPGGMTFNSRGELIVDAGVLFTPGSIVKASGGTASTLIPNTTGQFDNAQPLVMAPLRGDYQRNGRVDGADLLAWQRGFGLAMILPGANPDGDADGFVNAGDAGVWANNFGAEAGLVFADFLGTTSIDGATGNRLMAADHDGQNLRLLGLVPPAIPQVPPPNVFLLSNFPSGMAVTPFNTLIVSSLGLANRPDNRGALHEYDAEGNLLRTIAGDLPPISAIAWAAIPMPMGAAIPEPGAALLLAVGWLCLSAARRQGRPTEPR